MIGRAAYHHPARILAAADRRIFGACTTDTDPFSVAEAMRPYIARHLAAGGRLGSVTRHMLGLFSGRPGARAWRRALSEAPGGDLGDYDHALSLLALRAAA
jgi:tRNA-dihydrouridine synthase A